MSVFTSQSQLLPNAAVAVCAIPFFIGLNGLLQPRKLIAKVEFPAPTTPEAGRLSDALTRLVASRNIVVGSAAVAIWYRGDRALLGLHLLLVSFMPIVDALVSKSLIGGGVMNHLPVVPVLWGLGYGLLR